MARTLKSDKMLFWATLLLVGAGVVMVYSASAVQAQAFNQPSYRILSRQLAWVAIGLLLLLGIMRVDYHQFRRPVIIWSVLAVTTVALVAVFFFPPRNNTYRWISVSGLTFQPSELAKLAALFFTAALLERRMHRINDVGYALVPIGIVTAGLAVLIVREPDFGTAAVLLLIITTVVFAAGLSYRYLFGTMLVMLPVAMVLIATSGYRRRRLMAFLDPWSDPLGDGYQAVQSFLAVGSGGLFGRGLMGGVQKVSYLPEPHNDFIFAVIGEEFGLIGATAIIICFGVIAWRGLRTSVVAPDRFGSLLALGLTMMVSLQALVNLSMVIGLLPTKGIPLPFLSNGGSSLIVNMVAIGVLLNISQQSSSVVVGSLEGRE
jgi:cell division protein FtsW